MKNKIDSLKNNIENFSGKVFKKSEQVFKTSKISIEINSLEKSIEELYTKIGKKVYHECEINKEFKEEDIIKYCEEIKRLKKKIDTLEKEIVKIKNEK